MDCTSLLFTVSRMKSVKLVNLISDMTLIDLILIDFRLDATGLEITSEFTG